ncbi:unnamed protein product, partial [Prorocentrum cordatum]
VHDKMPANSPYCYNHKEIVEFAWHQASNLPTAQEREQAKQYFMHCRDKDPVKFTQLILDAEQQAGERRGRGIKRKWLDWSQYTERAAVKKEVEDAGKLKWCDYVDWTYYYTVKRMKPRSASDEEWKEAIGKTKGTEWQRGTGDTVEILVKKGDYVSYKQALSLTQEWATGEKQKKNPTEADYKKAMEKIKTGHASFSDSIFKALTGSAAASTAPHGDHHVGSGGFVELGADDGEPKKQRKQKHEPVPLSAEGGGPSSKKKGVILGSQQLKAQGSLKNSLDAELAHWTGSGANAAVPDLVEQGIRDSKDKIKDDAIHNGVCEGHLFSLKIRLDVLKAIHVADLQNVIRGFDNKSKAQLPVPVDRLADVKDIKSRIAGIMETETKEALKTSEASIQQLINYISQVRSAVMVGIKDLGTAVTQYYKRIEKEEKTAQAQKERAAKAAAKKAAKEAGKKSPPTAPTADEPRSIFDTCWELIGQEITKYTDMADFAQKGNDGRDPYIIANADKIKSYIEQAGNIKTGMASFTATFTDSAQATITGRASCPLNASSGAVSSLKSMMRQCAPRTPETLLVEDKIPTLGTSFSGALDTHRSAYFEHLGLGSIRYGISGTRDLVIFKYDSLAHAFPEEGPFNMLKQLCQVPVEKAKPILELGVFVRVPPGSLLVVPPAHIILEEGYKKQQTIGLRVSFMDLRQKDMYSKFIACIQESDPKFAQLSTMNKVVKALDGLSKLSSESAGSRDGCPMASA